MTNCRHKIDINKINQSINHFYSTLDRTFSLTKNLEISNKLNKEEAKKLNSNLKEMNMAVSNLRNFLDKISKEKNPYTSKNQVRINSLFNVVVNATSNFQEAIPNKLIGNYQTSLKEFNEELNFGLKQLDCDPINNSCVKCKPDPPGEVICIPKQ